MLLPSLISVQSALSNAIVNSVSLVTVAALAAKTVVAEIGVSDSTRHSVSKAVSSLVFIHLPLSVIAVAINTLFEFRLSH